VEGSRVLGGTYTGKGLGSPGLSRTWALGSRGNKKRFGGEHGVLELHHLYNVGEKKKSLRNNSLYPGGEASKVLRHWEKETGKGYQLGTGAVTLR